MSNIFVNAGWSAVSEYFDVGASIAPTILYNLELLRDSDGPSCFRLTAGNRPDSTPTQETKLQTRDEQERRRSACRCGLSSPGQASCAPIPPGMRPRCQSRLRWRRFRPFESPLSLSHSRCRPRSAACPLVAEPAAQYRLERRGSIPRSSGSAVCGSHHFAMAFDNRHKAKRCQAETMSPNKTDSISDSFGGLAASGMR